MMVEAVEYVGVSASRHTWTCILLLLSYCNLVYFPVNFRRQTHKQIKAHLRRQPVHSGRFFLITVYSMTDHCLCCLSLKSCSLYFIHAELLSSFMLFPPIYSLLNQCQLYLMDWYFSVLEVVLCENRGQTEDSVLEKMCVGVKEAPTRNNTVVQNSQTTIQLT